MKINEVVAVNEVGPIDTAKRAWSAAKGAWQGAKTGGVAGAFQGAKSGMQQAQSREDIKLGADDLQKRWNAHLAAKPGLTPQQINQELVDWTNKELADRIKTTQVPQPTLVNASDARRAYEYLYKRTQEYFATDPAANVAPASQLPTDFSEPSTNAEVDIKGFKYAYDATTGQWTDVRKNEVITNKTDISALNQRYYQLKQAAKAGTSSDPDRGPGHQTKYATPKVDASIDIRGAEYEFDIKDNTWYDENFVPVKDEADIQVLNKRYYDLKDLAKVGKAEDPDDKEPDFFDPRQTIGGNLNPTGSNVTPLRPGSTNPSQRESIGESRIIREGGNAIPSSTPVKKEDVRPVVERAKSLLPGELLKNIQTDIGSAGYKVESGDIDLMVEANDVVEFLQTADSKDPVKEAKLKLKSYFEAKGVEANVNGRNVSIGVKYKEQSTGKERTAQVDVMVIHEAGLVAPWHQHGLRGMYSDPEFKGSDLFMLISSIAKYLGLKFDPFGAKLLRRDNNEVVARTRKQVAKILLGPAAKEDDMNSVKSMLAALEKDPDKEGKLAQARQDAAKGLMKLPEMVQPGTAAWFRQITDVIK